VYDSDDWPKLLICNGSVRRSPGTATMSSLGNHVCTGKTPILLIGPALCLAPESTSPSVTPLPAPLPAPSNPKWSPSRRVGAVIWSLFRGWVCRSVSPRLVVCL
jgi:hypothetical protein